jgi:hypothetical protein
MKEKNNTKRKKEKSTKPRVSPPFARLTLNPIL